MTYLESSGLSAEHSYPGHSTGSNQTTMGNASAGRKDAGCGCRKGCRRGRPLCRRKDNPRNRTCGCPAYGWPHRVGSGRCWHGVNGAERMNRLAYGE